MDSLCAGAKSIIHLPWTNPIRLVQMALSSLTCVLMALLLGRFVRSKFTFHANLKLFIGSVLLLYLVYDLALFTMAARLFALFLFYHPSPAETSTSANSSSSCSSPTSPPSCPLAIPVWMSILLRLPTYQHALAYPLFHFAIMLERLRATLNAHNYEREGVRFGLAGCALIWSLTALFSVWMVASTLADPSFSVPQAYYSMISQYNSAVVINSLYCLLALVVLTSVADYAIMLKNRRLHRAHKNYGRNRHFYDLSRAYQLNENCVTMQLFVPLDVAFAVFFSLYLLFSALLRTYRTEIGGGFIPLYELNTCLLPLHSLITLSVYYRFLCRKGSANAVKVTPVEDQRKIYMDELRRQWNT